MLQTPANINLSLCSQFVNCKNCYFALIKNIFIGCLVMQTHLKFLLCLYLFVHKIINRKMYPNESMPFICLEVNKRQTKCTRLPFCSFALRPHLRNRCISFVSINNILPYPKVCHRHKSTVAVAKCFATSLLLTYDILPSLAPILLRQGVTA